MRGYGASFRNRSALPITQTEFRLIAALASIGPSSCLSPGYRAPGSDRNAQQVHPRVLASAIPPDLAVD